MVTVTPERIVPIRPLGFRELLDLPFGVIAAHIRQLAAVAAMTMLWFEAALIAVVLLGDVLAGGMDSEATAWVVTLMCVPGAWVVSVLMRGFATVAALADVLGKPVTVRSGTQAINRMRGPFLAASAVHTLLGVAVLLLALPVLTYPFVLAWLTKLRVDSFLVLPVIFGEDSRPGQPGTGYRPAVARSKALAKGGGITMAGLWLLLRGVLLLFLPPAIIGTLTISEVSGTERWAALVLASGAVLAVAAFASALDSAARVVSYFDRRCRREGLDIVVPG
jgi:hypothetical protein